VEKITNEASDGGGLFSSVADPGSCAFFDTRIRDGKKSRSGMNIQLFFLEVWKQFLELKILKFF
jgi:hypothetical protein